jgi:hypothetical protein
MRLVRTSLVTGILVSKLLMKVGITPFLISVGIRAGESLLIAPIKVTTKYNFN